VQKEGVSVRFTCGSLVRYIGVFLDARCLGLGVALAFSAGALGLAFVGGSATVEAEEYSAYSDPEKPALSFILSEERNIEEFQEEFALSGGEIEEVLAAVREENEALAREYAESEQIVEANEGLPDEEVKEKIAASDYDEEVKKAVAETKSTIKDLLPKERESDLVSWVDNQWQRERVEFRAGGDKTFEAASARGIRCKVFATQYHGYTRYEVALPHKKLKFDGGFRVRLRRGDHRTRAPVKEVGPWNLRDNYWQSRRYRDMWDDLPRCKPEAQAAYFNNYNRGRDQFGREVLNPAGVDLTPRVARNLGLRKYQNAWIYVRYPWVRR
jgi:hypothetical protein